MSIRKVFAGVMAAGAIMASSIFTSTPAQAAIGDCPSSYMCAWANINYTSARLQIQGSNSNWGVWGQSACSKYLTWNDCASSLYNNTTNKCFRFYAEANYLGGYHTLKHGDTIANLGTWNYNDTISSDQAFTTTGAC